MSFKPKNLTQGGQITAYRLRMFGQVNSWIFSWVLVLFVLCAGVAFWAITPEDTLRNGTWYWFGWMFSGLVPLMNPRSPATWEVHWHCEPDRLCTTKMTLTQMLADPWMQQRAADMLQNIRLCLSVFGVVAVVLLCLIIWYVGRIGRKESEDEFISGMTLTEDLTLVNRQLKKAGEKSDLQVAGLHMVRNAEIMNYLIHGTVNVGKSTIIRWLLDYIRKRGDRAIIYDSGGTFVETHYDERRDKILNTHDRRCENWVLWREGREVVDYENMTAALMPVEGDSDPFWVSSSRTIFSDTAMQFASDPQRNIERFLKTLLSIDLKSLREFLKNTPSANLVEEKIEKTAISIRSVLTNYAKSLRYLQGLDKEGKPEFSIREWMTEKQYDSSWLFISTTARHRKSVRPLITMWLSLATIFLQSMGEDSKRRVWIIGDEILNLQKLPDLGEHMAEGRKFGACFVLGIQNMPQLINVYGREMARAIFDLLNTRFYGRSPSAEVAKMVEDDLGNQRRREAREQNSFGLAQERDGISISKDKVREPVVDYDQIMKLPNLRFYVRLPGEYPVVKLSLKYREQKKYHPALIERDFRDNLSPELENIIRHNEREAAGLGLRFPAGEGVTEGTTAPPRSAGTVAVTEARSSAPVQTAPTPVRNESTVEDPKKITTQPEPGLQAHEPLPDNVRAFPGRETTGPDAVRALVRPQPAASAEKVPPVPEVKPAVTSFSPKEPVRTTSALDILARRTSRPAASDNSAASEDGAQGEAPELAMVAEKDDAGQLIVKTEGHRKGGHDSREDAYADQYRQANYRMADDEKNILRHREDYETWQEMGEHHEHGDYER
ncbi:type IV conjugative transfer system coupling protein TraD [Pantoea allii]|uniref:type IV conjugative transfer system coupling protein TraD n=1 Tax=Pantoea allii TaxID=574096 RepID=UPI001F4DED3A|nr:type IV conjugative transfer system coupling protein TraD [Pantoea allii]MCH9300013.1 type IV conjugative transfer system coupling protein TraD [Pantoea allii]